MDDRLNRTDRLAPLEMRLDEFRKTGYQLVDRIADFLDSIAARPVNPAESPVAVREALGAYPGELAIPRSFSFVADASPIYRARIGHERIVLYSSRYPG